MPIDYTRLVEAILGEIRKVVESDRLPDAMDEHTALYPYDDTVQAFLDLDSLEVLDVVSALEQTHGLLFPEEQEIDGIFTVGDLARSFLEPS